MITSSHCTCPGYHYTAGLQQTFKQKNHDTKGNTKQYACGENDKEPPQT